jgi:S1-C subfamily serine protease
MTGRPKSKGEDVHQPYSSNYIDCGNLPLYFFGEGLSYTKFEYESMTLDRKEMTADQTITVTVTLRNEQGTTTVLKTVDEDKLGVALEELSAKDKQALSLSYGLVVKHIKAGKMQKAGITKGLILLQVNDKQLRTVEDWNEAVKEANMSTDRVLWIRAKTQSGLNRSFTIELADEEKK